MVPLYHVSSFGLRVNPRHQGAWIDSRVRRGETVHAWHVRLLDGSAPREGDVLFCGACGLTGIFDV